MYWHCENEIGIAKLALRNFRIANLNLALRKWFWHCENGFAKFSHCEWNLALRKWLCEIFALRMEFGIAKMALRIHCEFRNAKFRIGFVRGNFRKATVYWVVGFRNAKLVCEHFAKFAMAANCLRTVCENPLLLNFYAFCPVFNCISFSSLFL